MNHENEDWQVESVIMGSVFAIEDRQDGLRLWLFRNSSPAHVSCLPGHQVIDHVQAGLLSASGIVGAPVVPDYGDGSGLEALLTILRDKYNIEMKFAKNRKKWIASPMWIQSDTPQKCAILAVKSLSL